MKRFLVMIAVAALPFLAGGEALQADERFVPKGHVYTPGSTELPPVNSRVYRMITEVDRRESEIYVSQKLRADFEDFMVHNMEMRQEPMRNGWRRY